MKTITITKEQFADALWEELKEQFNIRSKDEELEGFVAGVTAFACCVRNRLFGEPD